MTPPRAGVTEGARALTLSQTDLGVLENALAALIRGQLDHRIPIGLGGSGGLGDTAMDAVAAGLNLLAEELDAAAQTEARLREELAASQKLAAMGQLAAGIAHEINNPLTTTLLYANFLRQELACDWADNERDRDAQRRKRRSYVDKIRMATERCRFIVQGLLDFSRPGSSEFTALDLGAVVARAVTLVGPQMEQQGTALQADVPPGLMVRGAAPKIEQVLINILVNAAQALGEGGEVRIGGIEAGGEVVLAVRDSGPGIRPELLKRVFEPFFSTKAAGKGTGLGLAISRGIMQDHGGRLEVASEPRQGTCFKMIFPALVPIPSPNE